MNKNVITIWSLAAALLFGGCSSRQIDLTPVPTHLSMEPTYVATFFGPMRIDDEDFAVTIEEVVAKCHELNTPVQIRMTIENRSDSILKIPDLFLIHTNATGWSDIIALLRPIKDDVHPVLTDSSSGVVSKPSNVYEIRTGGMLEKVVEYQAPTKIFVFDEQSQNGYFLDIAPGIYLLKFDYRLGLIQSLYDIDADAEENRERFAISNQIEICFK